MKENLPKILAVSLLPASVFWFTGMNIYLGNRFGWVLTLRQVCLVDTIIAFLITLFGCGLLWILRKKDCFSTFLLFFLTLGIGFWFQSNIFLWRSEHWIYGILEILFYIALSWDIFSARSFFQKNIVKISSVLILAQTIALWPAYSSYDVSEHFRFSHNIGINFSEEDSWTISEKENVIVFILDSFGQGFFQDILHSNPNFHTTFKDFTSFSRCMSLYPRTIVAFPTLLTGSDFYDKLNLWDDSKTAYEQGIFHRPSYFPELCAMCANSSNVLPRELKKKDYQRRFFRTIGSYTLPDLIFEYPVDEKESLLLKKYFHQMSSFMVFFL